MRRWCYAHPTGWWSRTAKKASTLTSSPSSGQHQFYPNIHKSALEFCVTVSLHASAKHIVPCRFAVAAAAFSPFLKKALGSKRIWRGGLELGLWMGLGALLQAQPASAPYTVRCMD